MSEKSSFRKLFCHYFLKLRNVKEAAINAGCPSENAFGEGMKLLESNSIQRRLVEASTKIHTAGMVKAGLERLAFGEINDAVKLILNEEEISKTEAERLNLFNVSEIKKVKGGGIEIKLFDRQKALEKLWEIENSADMTSSAESFMTAIKKGSEAAFDGEEDIQNA